MSPGMLLSPREENMTRQIVSRGTPDNLPTRSYIVHPKDPDIYLPVRRDWRRLLDIDYRDPDCVCLVTICTRDRVPVFSRPPAAAIAKQLAEERPLRFHYSLLAYTILPDHVHMRIPYEEAS